MKKVVHLETQIRVVVGVIDDDGDLVERFVLAPNEGNPVQKFSGEQFQNAFLELLALKAQVEAKVKGGECSTSQGE